MMATRKKTKAGDFTACTLKSLPRQEWWAAALAAIDENPANEPPRQAMAMLETPDPASIAALTSKYWRSGSVKLGVAFMDGGSQDLKARILSHMNAWGERSNVKFSPASSGMAQVRIARQRGDGYWSYLGTDILQIPVSQPTMNLDSFSMSTPEAEYRRVVRHEVGHTLGFPHEHLRSALVNRLDRAKTIAYFRDRHGWTERDTVSNVLTPLDDAELVATLLTDETSIMAYQLPGAITKDGKPILGGDDINDTDFSLAAKLWPLAVTPPSDAGVTVTLSADLKAGTYTLVPR
jgi:hypothetical protein